jgi:hypothetical protein
MQYQYDEPTRTIELLNALASYGFPDSAFSKLHHFKQPERIASHRRYCEDLAEEGGRFRTNSNRLVQRRLELVLKIIQSSPITNREKATFDLLAQLARLEFPDDKRPLNEQADENDARGNSAA